MMIMMMMMIIYQITRFDRSLDFVNDEKKIIIRNNKLKIINILKKWMLY